MPDEAARVRQVSDWAEELAATHRQLLARERALKAKEVEIAKAMSDGNTAAAFEDDCGPEDVERRRQREEDLGWRGTPVPPDTMGKILDDAIQSVSDDLASTPPVPPGSLLLSGPELVAYVRVKAASVAAMAAQQAHEAAGKELRAAIEAMCRQLAPPV